MKNPEHAPGARPPFSKRFSGAEHTGYPNFDTIDIKQDPERFKAATKQAASLTRAQNEAAIARRVDAIYDAMGARVIYGIPYAGDEPAVQLYAPPEASEISHGWE